MRDLRTTNRRFLANRTLPSLRSCGVGSELPSVTKPFCVTHVPFGVWIREHWAWSKPGRFQLPTKEFQKTRQAFALVHLKAPRQTVESNFTFSPTIQLACFPQHTSNSFFTFNAPRAFQMSGPKTTSEERETVFRELRTQNVSSSREHSRANRETRTNQRANLAELFSPLFLTLKRTAGEIARFRANEKTFFVNLTERETGISMLRLASLRENLLTLRLASLRENLSTRHNLFVIAANGPARRTTVFAGPVSTSSVPELYQSTQFTLAQPIHTHVNGGLGAAAARNVTATLALDFVAPKRGEAELVQQRIAHFVSSPALTYVTRQQEISEKVIQALRGLRTAQPEPKAIAAPTFPSIEQLTSQVRTQLERELRIERERRGL